jgi:hypothetical protein
MSSLLTKSVKCFNISNYHCSGEVLSKKGAEMPSNRSKERLEARRLAAQARAVKETQSLAEPTTLRKDCNLMLGVCHVHFFTSSTAGCDWEIEGTWINSAGEPIQTTQVAAARTEAEAEALRSFLMGCRYLANDLVIKQSQAA